MKIKNRFKKPLAVLLSICMILPLLGYASYIALAKEEANPAESLISDGAMWLDEFLKGHPGANVYGFDGISAYALGDGDGEVGVDPNWFNIYVMKMGAESESGPYHLTNDNKSADDECENFFDAFSSGTLSDMTLTYPTSAYTPDNWPKSGAMTWTKQGFVERSAGFPQMTGTYNGNGFQYAIKSAYLGDSRIFNMGIVTVEGEERLWISLDRAGATAVVLPDTHVSERISLHYAPEEFPVTYSVTVDGKALEDMTEAEISAVWGDGITTPEQALTAVLGKNPTTSTRSQTADVQITVPAGTYGSVYFDEETSPRYPSSDYGNYKLGTEVSYTYKYTGTRSENSEDLEEWVEIDSTKGPKWFSYSEPYNYGEPGKADGEVKVRVVLETRSGQKDLKYDFSYLYNSRATQCFFGEDHILYNQNTTTTNRNYDYYPSILYRTNTVGDLTYNEEDGTYNWEWTFRVGRDGTGNNRDSQNGVLRFGINGEQVDVPEYAHEWTTGTGNSYNVFRTEDDYIRETVLSDGSVVRVEYIEKFLYSGPDANDARGYGYYKITVTNAKRNIVITDFATDNNYSWGRLIPKSLEGVHLQYKYQADTGNYNGGVLDTRGRYSNPSDYTTNESNWHDLNAGGLVRYQTDNNYRFNFTQYGHQIRVSLNPGYVWPGTGQDGTLATTVNDINASSFKTDVWADPPTLFTNGAPLVLEMDDINDAWVKSNSGTTASPNLVGHPYDTSNNNAIWYYTDSLSISALTYDGKTISQRITNTYGKQLYLNINAVQQTYQIKYLPGITVNNGEVTVTGGNLEYNSTNSVTGKRRADGFKWFVLDEDSMPFAGTNAIDDKLYTMQDGSNRAMVSIVEPIDNSSVSSAEFQYWVLTDMDGYPVDKNGNRVDVSDESTWVKYYPGEYIDLPELDAYTKKEGAADFEGGDVQRYTITLTAYWGEPETPYINFVTANSDAYYDADSMNKAEPKTQFVGTWYNKTDGNPIYDGDTTPESDKIKVAIPVVSFLDMDEVMSGGDGSQQGVTITMAKNTLLNYMRSQGGDYLWYALQDEKNGDHGDYIWNDVDHLSEIPVWFLYTLGSLKISSSIDGVKTGIEYKITFQLPADNPLTAGNEQQFFGTSSYKVATDQGDITLTKGEDGEYVGYFTLQDKDSIEFTKLPNGTWYLLELAEDGHNDNSNRGYVLKDGARGDVYDFTASTVWDEHKDTKDANMTIDKILTDGVVSYGNKGNGIVAYDTHEISLTVLGTYTVDLKQESVHPDKDPTTDNEAVNTDDTQLNVQNFSYLTYTVKTTNLTEYKQDLKVVLGINSVDISKDVDQDGLDGVRILNLEAIDGDSDFIIEEISSTDGDEVYRITLSDGTEIIYDCTGEVHTMTWIDEDVASGDFTVHTIKTSVPAVRGLTDYDGTAYVYDTDSPNSVLGEKSVASNDVKARVYSYWLRILAYVVDEGYKFPAGVEEPTFKFRVTLDDSDPSDSLNDTIHYMLFNSAEDFGTGSAAEGSPFEVRLQSTGTPDEYYFDFTLKHGQRIVIYDLDEDFTYKVEATNLQELDYLQSKLTTNTTGSVGSNGADAIGDGIDMVAFHFYPTQSLTVNSTVNDGIANTTKTFNYDITLTLPEGLDWDDDNPVPEIKIGNTTYTLAKQDDVTDENNKTRAVYKVTVPLGNGDSLVIPNIPESTEYSIAASIDDGYSFSARKGTNSVNTPNNTINGTLDSESDVYDVTVTKSGQLTITANVKSSLQSDLEGTYRFLVILKDADGNPVSGTFQMGSTTVTFNAQGRATVNVPVNATGDGTASGSVTVTGLPADTSYTVSPNTPSYMEIDVEVDATGTLGAGAEATVERTFTRKNGSLTINKEVDDYNKTNDGESFSFTVTLTDNNGNSVDGTFKIGEESITFTDGIGIVTVSVDDSGKGSVTISGIPAGLDYEIVENLDEGDEFYPNWSRTDVGNIAADDEGGTAATCINEKIVSTEIDMGKFEFILSDVRYNPTSHHYFGYRVDPQSGDEYNYIKVINKTNKELPVKFEYEPYAAYSPLIGSFTISTGDLGNYKTVIPSLDNALADFNLSLTDGVGVEVTVDTIRSGKFMSGKVIVTIGEEGVEEP